MAFTVDIKDQVTEALKGFQQDIAPAHINPAIGAAVVLLFQNWFLSMPPNKLGWPSTGFYAGAARATHFSVLADNVLISVAQLGMRQRLEGGEIHPTGDKKYLTIPAREEAYGKRAGEFNLRVLFRRDGSGVHAWALAEYAYSEVSFGKARKDGSRKVTPGDEHGAIMFWLVKSVTQQPDPSVLPPDNVILATVIETIDSAVARSLRRQGQG